MESPLTMKKSRKKVTKKTSVERKKPKTSFVPYIIAALGIIIILIAINMWPKQSDVAATVNGQEITDKDLDFQYKLLPDAYKQTFSREQVLEQIIDEELIVQAAQRSDVAVTDEDVQTRVQQIMAQNDLSANDLQTNLDNLNITQAQFEKLIRRQLTIDRYFNQTLSVSVPDDATLEAIYNISKSQYAIPEQVTVRHVLISQQREDAALVAKRVYDAVRNGTDFCYLVENASDDRGSRETCGLYTFPRGFMVPPFEQAAFSMTPGEVRMVQTEFGYHIIEKINSSPAGFKTFADVRPELLLEFQSAEHNQQYRKLVDMLRSQATIAYANGTTIGPAQPPSISPAPVAEPIAPMPPAEPVPETVVSPEPTTPEVPPAAVDENLFSCIAGKATLYGTTWSTDTRDIRELFTKKGASLNYIACDGGGCPGIKAYPTWKIDGQEYLGRMTIDELKTATNC
jgi:parvulin-like peptidyl-prolyl isomerase